MKKLKKNGFTLIELLSVVVILGVITSIAVGGYNLYISKTNKTYYENLSSVFRTAVIDYYSDNLGKLPQNIGDEKKMTLDEMLKENLVLPFVDSKGNPCETAHFYNHENVGSWMSYGLKESTIYTAWLISNHMEIMQNTKYSGKLPEFLKKDLQLLYEGDRQAH